MRILHVVPTYLPAVRYGGPIYSVHGLCKALAAQGHEVHVFTTNVDGPHDSNVPLGESVDMEGVKVWYFPSRFLRRLYCSSMMAKELRRSIVNFDLVHLHSVFLWPTLAAARLAQKADVPYVVSPRGMLVKDLLWRKSFWLKSAWVKLFERRTLEMAAFIHTTSETEAAELRAFAFKLPKSVVIPNGVDSLSSKGEGQLSSDVLDLTKGAPYALFLGRINWKKGLDRLIGAWCDIPDMQLVIAGNDKEGYLSALQQQINEANLTAVVKILGRGIREVDKTALYSSARLFILPSYSENFGNTVLEAMAVGCPVVVTPEVGAAGVVKESGSGLVVDGEPGKLAAAIRALLEDEQKMNRMGEVGKIAVEAGYTWPSIARRMEKAYCSILDNAG